LVGVVDPEVGAAQVEVTADREAAAAQAACDITILASLREEAESCLSSYLTYPEASHYWPPYPEKLRE
jgi:hypothetical protein